MSELSLGLKQELFIKLQVEWVQWVLSHPGWHLRAGEGHILQSGAAGKGRKAKHIFSGISILVKDLVHMDGGTHYMGLGQDWNLFIDPGAEGNVKGAEKLWVSDGNHPAWLQLGVHWETMHPLCRWGGRFKDSNHFSLEHNGKK